MFEFLFLKWENLADAHIVCWILIVQSDTLPVVGVLRQWLSGGGGGGTPIFSYIFRFGALFFDQSLRKVILLGVWRFVDFFIFFYFFFGGGGGHYEIRPFFWGGGYIIRRFKVKIQNIFLGRKYFKFLIFLIFFWFFILFYLFIYLFIFFWGWGVGGGVKQ